MTININEDQLKEMIITLFDSKPELLYKIVGISNRHMLVLDITENDISFSADYDGQGIGVHIDLEK